MPTITSDESSLCNKLAKLNPFIYRGYFYDSEIKMYYLKSRYYDPDLGRFINADAEVGPVGETMSMNLYAYCKCNPINYSDENGNCPSWATKLCIGLAVIAVCAIGGAISAAMNPKFCFVARTLVLTKQGLKAIKEIQSGD